MDRTNESIITIETSIDSSLDVVWAYFTKPEHITGWNFASDDWCCPTAINNLHPGGRLVWRMEARDGSMAFDFSGTYSEVVPKRLITYRMDDDREVQVAFTNTGSGTHVKQTFEAEGTHSIELQKTGWQAILDNFKKYVEGRK